MKTLAELKQNESTIEIRHNGACVRITRKEGRCYYSTSGQPTRQLIERQAQVKLYADLMNNINSKSTEA